MTKPKTAKGAAEAKKPAAKASKPKKTTEKAKPAAAAKVTKKVAEKPKATKAAPAKKTVKEKTVEKPAKAATTVEPAKVQASEPKATMPAFSNSGLGIKVSTKKPVLSVAPAVMILGKTAAPKIERTARPSERRLSKKEQLDIKNFLLEKRERLLAGMRRELAMQKERAESKAADEVDKATDAYDEDLSFEIATANDQELEEIQVALEKIERGTYGECEICGCSISPSRLKILPSATTCVQCRGQEEMARSRDDGPPEFSIMGEDGEADTDSM